VSEHTRQIKGLDTLQIRDSNSSMLDIEILNPSWAHQNDVH